MWSTSNNSRTRAALQGRGQPPSIDLGYQTGSSNYQTAYSPTHQSPTYNAPQPLAQSPTFPRSPLQGRFQPQIPLAPQAPSAYSYGTASTHGTASRIGKWIKNVRPGSGSSAHFPMPVSPYGQIGDSHSVSQVQTNKVVAYPPGVTPYVSPQAGSSRNSKSLFFACESC